MRATVLCCLGLLLISTASCIDTTDAGDSPECVTYRATYIEQCASDASEGRAELIESLQCVSDDTAEYCTERLIDRGCDVDWQVECALAKVAEKAPARPVCDELHESMCAWYVACDRFESAEQCVDALGSVGYDCEQAIAGNRDALEDCQRAFESTSCDEPQPEVCRDAALMFTTLHNGGNPVTLEAYLPIVSEVEVAPDVDELVGTVDE